MTGTIPGGYGDALGDAVPARNYPRWTVALNLSYPLGVSSQEASVARARVQLNQVAGADASRSSCRSRPT